LVRRLPPNAPRHPPESKSNTMTKFIMIMLACTLPTVAVIVYFGHEQSTQGCFTFRRPTTVYCEVDNMTVTADRFLKMCHFRDPDRWVLTSSAGQDTLIGADKCVARESTNIAPYWR
jgi:hypothetical protein